MDSASSKASVEDWEDRSTAPIFQKNVLSLATYISRSKHSRDEDNDTHSDDHPGQRDTVFPSELAHATPYTKTSNFKRSKILSTSTSEFAVPYREAVHSTNTPDELSQNRVEKLSNEMLLSKKVVLHNPLPESEGWFKGIDDSLQYTVMIDRGVLFVTDRKHGAKLPLSDLLSRLPKSIWSSPGQVVNAREEFDPTFLVQDPAFFHIGRVFAAFLTEPLSDQSMGNLGSQRAPEVQYRDQIYSQSMYFVVVHGGRGFCYACPILSFNGMGTTKAECDPSEHVIAYMEGDSPTLMLGEYPYRKEPIEIAPSVDTARLEAASRICFGRIQTIPYDWKVKDIGRVISQHVSRLSSYWKQEFWDSSEQRLSLEHDATIASSNPRGRFPVGSEENISLANKIEQPSANHNVSKISAPQRYTFHANEMEYAIITEVGGPLHSNFSEIRRPRAFFKKGRAFMVFWPELAGLPESERTVYWKIRRFVVIRGRSTYCLCLSVNTYQGQGTAKAGIGWHDHAPVVQHGRTLLLHPDEEVFDKEALTILVEDPSVDIDSMSRMNFAKVYTVEYNVKVRNIGRIAAESIKQMEDSFEEAVKFTSP